MKANEAPEKIYRTTTYLDNDKGKTLWKETPVKGAENIEYTRTDAFIEKACDWFDRNLHKTEVSNRYGENIDIVMAENGDKYSLIADFRNYMKG